MMILKVLTRPLAYLTISYPRKWIVDWLIPILIAIPITAIVIMGDQNSKETLLISFLENSLAPVVSILPGFYIAALSAIVVFNRNDIDMHMPEPTPRIKTSAGSLLLLTRRRFLALTFSFLTAQSLITLVAISLYPSAISIIEMLQPPNLIKSLSHFYFLLIVYMFSQIIVVTFLCLYYLGERLLQPDP
ncbi:hypothetical protein [Cobetia sp. MC34]|uniref:hypothetical protein n=1 Tax=Cobetia sp. MC34 TaxID=2785080 RepID=UPI001BC934B3|nr:hypothetical protein [Cobetia sp. MC34]MBS4155453.1 hypothetical protein [Cobetia sp. MC34]